MNDCDHRDDRGSTVMQTTGDRWTCIVCGWRFQLVSIGPADRPCWVDPDCSLQYGHDGLCQHTQPGIGSGSGLL